jgi:hypothetical protein
MNPLEQIKEGITRENWKIVCDGYAALTGEFLHTEQEPGTGKIEVLQQIYDIVADALEEAGCAPSVTIVMKKTRKKKLGRPKKKNKKTNVTDEDEDEEDASLRLDDDKRTVVQKEVGGTRLITNEPDPYEIEANKKKAIIAQKNKMKLQRTEAKTYDVKCNECEKEFASNRPGGKLGQKCSKCLQDKKSRFV